MTRRHDKPLYGKRYCGNKKTKQLHDLERESFDCQISATIFAGLAVGFNTIEEAKKAGYHTEHFCMGDNISYLPEISDTSEYTESENRL